MKRQERIDQAQDRDRRRALVNAVMNLQASPNAGNFLTSWETVSVSVCSLLHGFGYFLYFKTRVQCGIPIEVYIKNAVFHDIALLVRYNFIDFSENLVPTSQDGGNMFLRPLLNFCQHTRLRIPENNILQWSIRMLLFHMPLLLSSRCFGFP